MQTLEEITEYFPSGFMTRLLIIRSELWERNNKDTGRIYLSRLSDMRSAGN